MKYLFGNWKMNMSKSQISNFSKKLKKNKNTELCVGVAIPSVYVGVAQKLQKKVLLGLENISEFDNGAYTGQISSVMAKDMQMDFCLVGHSECRQYLKESNLQINTKIKKLLSQNILPILCVGETLTEREQNKTKEVLKAQIQECLNDISNQKIIVAYEPIWAIGTGKSASLEQIKEVCSYLKQLLSNILVPVVLYGGSVTENNCKEIVNLDGVDGVLVGSASLYADKFNKMQENIGGAL